MMFVSQLDLFHALVKHALYPGVAECSLTQRRLKIKSTTEAVVRSLEA